MIAAREPVQRPADARLLAIDGAGRMTHGSRRRFAGLLRAGDLVVANDAATLPASLHGSHARTGAPVEVRLAQRAGLEDVRRFTAVVFGAGDFHTRTEDRPAPPPLIAGDRLALGPLPALIEHVLHPRLVMLRFEGGTAAIWDGLARHGRPIQYSHLAAPLAIWDTWTPLAAAPVAFEPPSAGFALDWAALDELRSRRIAFATLTHAAGISSTGDAELDRRLPFDEPYRIPTATAQAISQARARGGRVVAIGTTVVRALEDAARDDGSIHAGEGLARGRIGAATRLRVVDAILSGTHEPETSHHELLRAFVDEVTLARADRELESRGYRTHEFGDSVLIERSASRGLERLAPKLHSNATA
jgi:S-adenosylmethionine:tRNA ribosyltransferase-isomerase